MKMYKGDTGGDNCMYCNANVMFREKYIVKKAVKPKGMPNRSIVIGCCCEDCEEKGEKTFFEYGI